MPSGRGVWFDPSSARDHDDADAGERALKLADAEFCVRLLQPAPIVPRFLDAPPYYFDAHAPARRMIESWDGSDETAESSRWIEVCVFSQRCSSIIRSQQKLIH